MMFNGTYLGQSYASIFLCTCNATNLGSTAKDPSQRMRSVALDGEQKMEVAILIRHTGHIIDLSAQCHLSSVHKSKVYEQDTCT